MCNYECSPLYEKQKLSWNTWWKKKITVILISKFVNPKTFVETKILSVMLLALPESILGA